jgi:tRNA threonylcarbamoyladenosine biosynthesis protein TsaE
MNLVSRSAGETKKIAAKLAQKIIRSRLLLHVKPRRTQSQKHATVIALEGELGAGKTVFVKGFARAFGIKQAVNSPTFILVHPYEIKLKIKNAKLKITTQNLKQNTKYKILDTKYRRLYHVDAYRLRDHRDLVPLGIKEILADPENVVLIEWAERVKKILPRRRITVHLDHAGEKTREIKIKFQIPNTNYQISSPP